MTSPAWRLTAVLFLIVNLHGAPAQATLIGTQASELTFPRILNSPLSSANSSDFAGKLLILDFWATWCTPCITGMPHLQQLQEKYAGQVQVLTITDEPEERIRTFLAHRPMALPVVLDPERKLAAAFPHRAIPHSVILDEKRIVRAITTSAEITDTVIENVLQGRTAGVEEKKDDLFFDPERPLSPENALYQCTVTSFQEGAPSLSTDFSKSDGPYAHRRILAVNLALENLYALAYGFSAGTHTRVEVQDKRPFKWSKRTTYCIDLIVPAELGARRFAILQQQLGELFPYTATIQERESPVKVLRLNRARPLRLRASSEGAAAAVSMSGRGLWMKASPLRSVADFIQAMLVVPVLDDTELQGRYDLELPWYRENPSRIHDDLAAIGLELVNERRALRLLVIADRNIPAGTATTPAPP